jgi:hypothetical protein
MKPQSFDLDSEIFDEFRNVLSIVIRNTAAELIDRNLVTGTISAKIKIEMKREADEDGVVTLMPEISSDIGSKIGASGKMKLSDQKGLIMRQGKNGELIIGTNQISIDEVLAG